MVKSANQRYDIKRGQAEAFANTSLPKAEVFRSLEALLQSDIDAVIIATRNSLHYPQTIAALQADKHVLTDPGRDP